MKVLQCRFPKKMNLLAHGWYVQVGLAMNVMSTYIDVSLTTLGRIVLKAAAADHERP